MNFILASLALASSRLVRVNFNNFDPSTFERYETPVYLNNRRVSETSQITNKARSLTTVHHGPWKGRSRLQHNHQRRWENSSLSLRNSFLLTDGLADRQRRQSQALATEIFGKARRQSAPGGGNNRKPGAGAGAFPSLASRVGVGKVNYTLRNLSDHPSDTILSAPSLLPKRMRLPDRPSNHLQATSMPNGPTTCTP